MDGSGRPLPIPLEAWSGRQTRAFSVRRDPRDLLVVEHPWEPSRKGGRGEWTASVPTPQGWRPGEPLFVSFYQSDNYSGAHTEGPWMGTQCFTGHRFKQLLVGRHVVWEADVADEELAGSLESGWAGGPGTSGFREAYRVVEVTRWAAPRLRLTLRVVDRVASTTVLPGDAYRRFSWSSCDPVDARRRFQTTVYFGDVHLTRQPQIARPAAADVAVRAP
ncbi:MAG: hypothetical protein AB1505_26575, partial [Candidatus Latescibacterota bacterium]